MNCAASKHSNQTDASTKRAAAFKHLTDGHIFDLLVIGGGATGLGVALDAANRREDGTAMSGKRKQFVPHGGRVRLAFPGGAGYGDVGQRDAELIVRDLARGYISEQAAREHYGLSEAQIKNIMDLVSARENSQ